MLAPLAASSRGGKGPARPSSAVRSASSRRPSHIALAMTCSSAMPVRRWLRSNRWARSGAAMFPVAAGANGQPPKSPVMASGVTVPSAPAALALALAYPVLRVLWKWYSCGTLGASGSTTAASSATWVGTPTPVVSARAISSTASLNSSASLRRFIRSMAATS